MTHSDEENLFQLQLNTLFNASKSRLTNRKVVNALLTRNCQISAPYLSQLRTGTRQNPSDEVVGALADYFGVTPAYFFTTPQNDRNLTCSEDGQIVARLHHGAHERPTYGRGRTPLNLYRSWMTWQRNCDPPISDE